MGRWDLYLKTLVWESPQDFVSLLLAGARYLGRREGQFQTRELRSDGMIEAEYEGEALLIHVEFQVKKEEKIGERLLSYSFESRRLYELPVLSCVIYLKRVVEPPKPPLTWDVPGWDTVLWFKYISIELAETPVEDLEQKQLVGISPLLLLSKGGATREILDQAITRLEAEKKAESLIMTKLIACMVFENEEDLDWIEWRFAKMHDFLLENSRAYQQMLKEGVRQSIETVVQARYPALLELVRARLERIQDQEGLQQMLVAMSTASTEKKARRYLLALNDGK